MNQDHTRDQDSPNRESNMEPAEGSREHVRNRDSSSDRDQNSGGISNRPLDRERCEQDQIPERGSQSER